MKYKLLIFLIIIELVLIFFFISNLSKFKNNNRSNLDNNRSNLDNNNRSNLDNNNISNLDNNKIVLLKDNKTRLLCPFGPPDTVCDSINNHGSWEEHIQKDIFEKYVKKGDIVIDGGAFIGNHTVKLSQLVGDSGKVYAFEADPVTFKVLEKNIHLNNCKNVILFNKGIGDKNGYINITNKEGRKNTRGGTNWGYVSDNSNDAVEVITIDSLNLPRLDFMKLDVEGMEPNVFIGMSNTIKTYKPIILFEAWKDRVENTKRTLLSINKYNIKNISNDDYLAY